MIYALVVLIKLYISATTPGEIASVINEKDLRIEESLANLEGAFQRVVDRDSLCPHTKFLYVIQRLGDRFNNIKRRQQEKAYPLPSKLKQEQHRSPSSASTRPRSNSRPASASGIPQTQGLHLLSEVAVSNDTPRTSPLVTPLQSHQSASSAQVGTPINPSSASTPVAPARHLPSSATSTPGVMVQLQQQLPHAS